jgi:hypothetical protein
VLLSLDEGQELEEAWVGFLHQSLQMDINIHQSFIYHT